MVYVFSVFRFRLFLEVDSMKCMALIEIDADEDFCGDGCPCMRTHHKTHRYYCGRDETFLDEIDGCYKRTEYCIKHSEWIGEA